MYPLGVLFGLGFDTATEVGILGISAQACRASRSGHHSVPASIHGRDDFPRYRRQYPDGGAYGWAFVKPIRKLDYNLTITAASVVVAVVVGGFEALNLIGDQLGLNGRRWLLGRDRRGQRQFWHPRLRHSGDFPHRAADLFHRRSRQTATMPLRSRPDRLRPPDKWSARAPGTENARRTCFFCTRVRTLLGLRLVAAYASSPALFSRQGELEVGTAGSARGRPQFASVGFDDRTANREPHSQSIGFGGVESIKYAFHVRGVEARSRITHSHDDTVRFYLCGADQNLS